MSTVAMNRIKWNTRHIDDARTQNLVILFSLCHFNGKIAFMKIDQIKNSISIDDHEIPLNHELHTSKACWNKILTSSLDNNLNVLKMDDITKRKVKTSVAADD